MAIPVPMIMAAVELVPGIMKYFKGDKEAAVAEKVVGAAKVLAGTDDAAAAIEAVKKDPTLLVQLEAQAKDIAIADLQADVAKQGQVNATMTAELASNSLFKSGWRPFFGWCMTPLFALWVLTIIGLPVYMILMHPERAGEIITLTIQYISAMMLIWGAAFAVLGVNITSRSRDKQVAAGLTPPAGLLGIFSRKG